MDGLEKGDGILCPSNEKLTTISESLIPLRYLFTGK